MYPITAMDAVQKWNQTIVSDRPHFGYTDLDGRISKWPYLDEDINIQKCQLPFFFFMCMRYLDVIERLTNVR